MMEVRKNWLGYGLSVDRDEDEVAPVPLVDRVVEDIVATGLGLCKGVAVLMR